MNGVHDFGGMQGYGPVRPEPNEPPFHAEWERRAFAFTLAMGATGQWSLDMSRSMRERLPAVQYLSSTYYEIWLAGLERLMLERGLVFEDELASARMRHAPLPVRRLAADRVAEVLARGASTLRHGDRCARFAVGDTVRMRNMHPPGHTRLPRYVRGRVGRIAEVHGAHVFADAHALSLEESPQWLYTVCFEGRELWGEESDPSLEVSVDAWEPYIEEKAA
ncbi:MAG TPA: nitrile hydratase subunit beta [Ramlibacter sp.]|uniref:nitrile hydratase subunit beta n=1 Tax=Ramlibacter sp. TaxID=1917967 RepID=UPI002CF269DF|nr:nitrile hydratase subunit beta [Ramlibacter sp.]HVZ46190.1 nitrile hydratase subunit beta [Ramlibacter sp.]